jgi:hypothetical protein
MTRYRAVLSLMSAVLLFASCGGSDRPERERGPGGWRQISSFSLDATVRTVTVGEEPDAGIPREEEEPEGTGSSADSSGVMSVTLDDPPEELVDECGLEQDRADVYWTTSTVFAPALLTRLEGGLEGAQVTITGTYYLRVAESDEDAGDQCQLLASEIREPGEAETPVPTDSGDAEPEGGQLPFDPRRTADPEP